MKKVNVNFFIERNAIVCKKIKQIYYENEAWSMVIAKKVSEKFNHFKKNAKIYHPDFNDEEFANILSTYTHDDIKDCLSVEVLRGT